MRSVGRGVGVGVGCAAGVLLGLALTLALGYFLVWRPVQGVVQGVLEGPAAVLRGPERAAPAPPAREPPVSANTQPVTRAEVEALVRVRRTVLAQAGGSLDGLQRAWAAAQAGQNLNLLELAALARDLGGQLGGLRAAHGAALAQEGLSPERYADVRRTVNRGLGLPDIDPARAAGALRSGQLGELFGSVQTATDAERALVAPHAEELRRGAALGLLGM